MGDLFKTQFDYIYFFYGLGFFFLAIICYNIRNDQRYGLRWPLLGAFGLIHGLNEWGDIYEISYGGNFIFSIVHLVILGISYFALFEFGRARLLRKGKAAISPKVYIILLALAFLGLRYGFNGMNATFRYFLGFPAALVSGCAIIISSRADISKRRPLLVLSAVLILYGFFSGIIVPRVDFYPAQRLNIDSFFHLTGIPVQLIRGILAILSAMALWFYQPLMFPVKLTSPKYFFQFKPSKWMILLTLFVLVALGWVFTNYLDYYGGIQLIRNSTALGPSPLNRLTRELSKLEEAAITISGSGEIKNILLNRSAEDPNEAREIIERQKVRFDNLDCLILDHGGMVAFSVLKDSYQNLGAKSFALASYFKKAMSGKTGYSFELGMSYNKRTYYVSYPVKDRLGNIIGAVVLRKSISAAPIIRYRLISIFVTMFVCLLSIIYFVSLRRREDLILMIEEVNRRLKAIDSLKTDFIAIVSHELRTPLTSIKSAASLLSRDWADQKISKEKKRELLDVIINNTDRQTRMITDLLDISKIEAGVMNMHLEATDIIKLGKEMVSTFRDAARVKGISLNLGAEKESLVLMADPDQTRRIFSNLIVNAIKFTPSKGKVTVNVEEMETEVKISVCDNGIGISNDDQKHIFQKFYRADNAYVRQKGGSGLGLLIAKGLVEAQGGRIWVESRLNQGSTFYFTIPLKVTQKEGGDESSNIDHRG